MVLSNKKLKHRLRSLVSESISASESNRPLRESSNGDASEELTTIKELLGSKSRKKPKPTKPRRRRRQTPNEGGDEEGGDGKGKKRKREGENGGEDPLVEEMGKKRRQEKARKKKEKEEMKRKERQRVEDALMEEMRKKRKEEKARKKEEKKERKRKEREEKERQKVEGEVGKDSEEGGGDEKAVESVNGDSKEKKVEEPTEIDESEMKKVYVGGIPYYSSEDDIRSFFEGCGTITEVDCMTFPETGKFRGIAFLTFKTEAAAKRALALDGADMGGFYLKIQPYKAQRTQQKSDFAPEVVEGYNRAYIGNLSWDITEDDLKQIFSDCKISSIRFGMDKETGDFKGYAHIDFSDTVSLAIALKLDQKVVGGRPVRIRCAVPKKGEETSSGKKKKTDHMTAENDGSGGGRKKKRRTCYECGVPGHLSSACPRKKGSTKSDGNATES